VTKDNRKSTIRIGCAGWALPKAYAARFPAEGSHLARYAGALPAVEINSSFYKPHKPATYTKWAESVPEEFRFAVKLPKEATHGCRLVDAEAILDRFLPEATALDVKLGPILVQLPPSLEFSATVPESPYGGGIGAVATYRTGFPSFRARRISSQTPALRSHPSSMSTTTSSHRRRCSMSTRCQNAQSVGRQATSGWL
jgi:hypothetical protein